MSYRVLKASTTKSKGINMKKEIYIYIYIVLYKTFNKR